MLKIILAAAITAALLSPAAGSACQGGNDGRQDETPATPTIQNREACDQIHEAIGAGSLDDHLSEARIKLAASRDRVRDQIRTAIDTYYRGDKLAGKTAMLKACADAGLPQ